MKIPIFEELTGHCKNCGQGYIIPINVPIYQVSVFYCKKCNADIRL